MTVATFVNRGQTVLILGGDRMEIIRSRGPAAAYLASRLREEEFVLFDVGCSGGIDQVWRLFGDNLRAVGFDPNVSEVERLNKSEKSNKIRFEPAFVGVPKDHPLALRHKGRAPVGRNPWGRLAVNRTMQLLKEKISLATDLEKVTDFNAWNMTKLADPDRIFLPDYIRVNSIESIDFIKIDIDGEDFDVLSSLDDVLHSTRVLGLCTEVNFFGSDSPDEHTFHNTDRFLKRAGFELFALTTRAYAMAALPERYCFSVPAQSLSGRILQGDAIYLRDLCAPENEKMASIYGPEKLIKLSALFSVAGLPDCAAEVLAQYSRRLDGFIDVELALNLLARESTLGRGNDLSRKDIFELLEKNKPELYAS